MPLALWQSLLQRGIPFDKLSHSVGLLLYKSYRPDQISFWAA